MAYYFLARLNGSQHVRRGNKVHDAAERLPGGVSPGKQLAASIGKDMYHSTEDVGVYRRIGRNDCRFIYEDNTTEGMMLTQLERKQRNMEQQERER